MPTITAKDGTELYWREWGEGAPHGLIYTHMERLHADMLAFLRES